MIVKKCFSCGSSSVNTLKSSNNWKTIHQFCSKCGKDQTKRVLAVKKARQTHHKPLGRKNTPQSVSYALGLVFWAIMATIYLIASPAVVTYAAPVDIPENLSIVNQLTTKTPEIVNKPETLHDKITRYSSKYGIPRESMRVLVGCETAWSWDVKIQSKARYKNGNREQSFGLAQIHAPAHPNISYEQMTDPDFALDFIGKNWKKRADMWVNCVEKYGL